jgi:hypothetical protein
LTSEICQDSQPPPQERATNYTCKGFNYNNNNAIESEDRTLLPTAVHPTSHYSSSFGGVLGDTKVVQVPTQEGTGSSSSAPSSNSTTTPERIGQSKELDKEDGISFSPAQEDLSIQDLHSDYAIGAEGGKGGGGNWTTVGNGKRKKQWYSLDFQFLWQLLPYSTQQLHPCTGQLHGGREWYQWWLFLYLFLHSHLSGSTWYY